jgi:hypothetical protein
MTNQRAIEERVYVAAMPTILPDLLRLQAAIATCSSIVPASVQALFNRNGPVNRQGFPKSLLLTAKNRWRVADS